jgi:hypothetical protein
MYNPWVISSAGLPYEGQPVEFILDGREVAMDGIYVRRIFRSSWMSYEAERVRIWRSVAPYLSTSICQPRRCETKKTIVGGVSCGV